jgi:hypothetical protein
MNTKPTYVEGRLAHHLAQLVYQERERLIANKPISQAPPRAEELKRSFLELIKIRDAAPESED